MAAPEFSATAETARRGDRARFDAAMFAPPALRERLFALIALNVELSRIPESVSEPMLGEIRLQWWADAIEAVFQDGSPEGHEVIEGLVEPAKAGVLDQDALMAMVDARRALLDPAPMDPAALRKFLADTGGALAASQVRALGGDDAAVEVAAKAGWAEGAGRLISALPALLAQGADMLPVEAPFDRNAALEGAPSPDLIASVKALAEDALVTLAASRRDRALVPKSARAPLLSVREQERRLRAVLAPNADIFASTGAISPFRETLSLFGRALTGSF